MRDICQEGFCPGVFWQGRHLSRGLCPGSLCRDTLVMRPTDLSVDHIEYLNERYRSRRGYVLL